jgi:hypothetical protein
VQVNRCGKLELFIWMGFVMVKNVFGQPQSPIPSVTRYSAMRKLTVSVVDYLVLAGVLKPSNIKSPP